jgi:hypothetical protein
MGERFKAGALAANVLRGAMAGSLTAALMLSACATAPGRDSSRQERPENDLAYAELLRLDAKYKLDAEGDCSRLMEAHIGFCTMTEILCRTAAREPTSSVARERCLFGKPRCAIATERAEARGCAYKFVDAGAD